MHNIYVKILKHSKHHHCACLGTQTYIVNVIKKCMGTINRFREWLSEDEKAIRDT